MKVWREHDALNLGSRVAEERIARVARVVFTDFFDGPDDVDEFEKLLEGVELGRDGLVREKANVDEWVIDAHDRGRLAMEERKREAHRAISSRARANAFCMPST